MTAIHLLTDDNYFRAGFDMLVKEIDCNDTHSVSIIMDDGVQFLYFIDVGFGSGRGCPASESTDFFLERVRLVVPKNTHSEKLSQIIKSYCRGAYRHVVLTPGERRVLLELARGITPNVSRAKLNVNYKTWHNFKTAGFKRIGIKNNVTFMRIINLWHCTGYPSVFKKVIPASDLDISYKRSFITNTLLTRTSIYSR